MITTNRTYLWSIGIIHRFSRLVTLLFHKWLHVRLNHKDASGVKTDNLDETKPVTDADVSDKKLMKLDPTLASLAEKDLNGKTNSFTSSLTHPLKDKDISVTLTLSAKAAEDIGGVLSSIAELLKIAVPPTYQVSRSPSPDALKMNLKR